MHFVNIKVSVPFETCKKCKKFEIEEEWMCYKDGAYTFYNCRNYKTCENAKEISEMEKE